MLFCDSCLGSGSTPTAPNGLLALLRGWRSPSGSGRWYCAECAKRKLNCYVCKVPIPRGWIARRWTREWFPCADTWYCPRHPLTDERRRHFLAEQEEAKLRELQAEKERHERKLASIRAERIAEEQRLLESLRNIDTSAAARLATELQKPNVGGLDFRTDAATRCPSCGTLASYYSWVNNNFPVSIFRYCTYCGETSSRLD